MVMPDSVALHLSATTGNYLGSLSWLCREPMWNGKRTDSKESCVLEVRKCRDEVRIAYK